MITSSKLYEARRNKILSHPTLNGIDYVEVLDRDLLTDEWNEELSDILPLDVECIKCHRQQFFVIYFLKPLESSWQWKEEQFKIEGGERVKNIKVQKTLTPFSGKYTILWVDRIGDFSDYSLHIIRDRNSIEPPENFDPILSSCIFNFKVECPRDFESGDQDNEISAPPNNLGIDYLTRDFKGFRRLIRDRLSVTLPQWKENSSADIGTALVEVMAYAADHLSYFQDAVATEAYLGTARKRISIRRHARLLDYPMHDGCNARVWVHFKVDKSQWLLAKTPLLTSLFNTDTKEQVSVTIDPDEYPNYLFQKPVVFETMYDVQLKPLRNQFKFHTWGEVSGKIEKGATTAVLALDSDQNQEGLLKKGDVLVLEELLDPESGLEAEVNPSHRHVVRLNKEPVKGFDSLCNTAYLEISWYHEDALPFDLILGEKEKDAPISAAFGNVVLADHGRTISGESLNPPTVLANQNYRPRLRLGNITQSDYFDLENSRKEAASLSLIQDPRAALPGVWLDQDGESWTANADLLNSDRFAPEFVVEPEEDGTVWLRFGDNVKGKKPAAHTSFVANYRIGKGVEGNVGAKAISHVVTDKKGITDVSNPINAIGGSAPESLDEVRRYAPVAFRTQKRAVTEKDYALIAERHKEVQKAQAQLRWTGSWKTIFLSVDRIDNRPVDTEFKNDLMKFMEPYRLSGQDIKITEPVFISIELVLRVRVKSSFLKGTVATEILQQLGSKRYGEGIEGFFHSNKFTFGQSVYLSVLVAEIQKITGVEWVETVTFKRLGEPAKNELEDGVLNVGHLEIVRLENNPNKPENGKLELIMEGGL